MPRSLNWANWDSLQVRGGRHSTDSSVGAKAVTAGATQQITVVIDAATLNAAGAVTAPATTQEWYTNGAVIPAGSLITSATLFVKTAFVGTSGTLDIGTYYAASVYNSANSKTAGDACDEDGIDAAIAVGDLGAREVVLCDGAQVAWKGVADADGLMSTMQVDGDVKIGFDIDTTAFTAGQATLVVEYIPSLI